MAGDAFERQENGIVKDITNAVKKNKKNPVTVKAGKTVIHGVLSAKKETGRSASGNEPYTDIVLETTTGDFNLSCKGQTAPSLAGGGASGLELVIPGISSKFMKEAFSHLKTKLKLKDGDKVPDVYGKLSTTNKKLIVVGTKAMGGPVDYMFIGPMDVDSSYDDKNNILEFNKTEMTPALEYAKSHELYFRLRARREDQRFSLTSKDNKGVPKIYGKSPSKGDSAGRIVVTDSVPLKAEIITI